MKSVKNTRVFVGMSGGVDSSVAAYLLKKKGYQVVGVFMHSFNLDGCEEKDAEDARRVAARLDIPFYVMDFEEEYKKYVVDYMVRGYAEGLTPNPDVMCNKEIKFGFFMKKALELGADFVATGHYVKKTGNRLFAARDKNKDQSYFLWTLTQRELKHCLFPIGEYPKPRVRAIAKKAGLSTAAKKDSQGICFLGKITIQDFLKDYISVKRGAVVNVKGEKIGEHQGAQLYTIGQRHGLDLKMTKSESKPHYVAHKDVKTNTITAVEGDTHSALYRKEVKLAEVNVIGKKIPRTVYARVRYRQSLARAAAVKHGKNLVLTFASPQKYIAPGQSAVLYTKTGEMLGGGIILE